MEIKQTHALIIIIIIIINIPQILLKSLNIIFAIYNNNCRNTDCIIKLTIIVLKFAGRYSYLGPIKILLYHLLQAGARRIFFFFFFL